MILAIFSIFSELAQAQGNMSFKVSKAKIEIGQVMVERGSVDLPLGYLLRLEKESCTGTLSKKNSKYYLFTFKACPKLSQVISSGLLTIVYSQEGGRDNAGGLGSGEDFVQYEVANFDEAFHRVNVDRKNGDQVSEGDLFNLFSPSNQFCVMEVIEVGESDFVVDSQGCEFEFEIRRGFKLEPKSLKGLKKDNKPTVKNKAEKKKNTVVAKKINLAPYYVHFAMGYGTPEYNSGSEKATVDNLEQNPSVSRLSLHFDLLGIYFPIEELNMMMGGNFTLARDSFSGSGISFEFYHFLIGFSSLYFPFGQMDLTGFFLRADLGLARQISTVVKNSETGANDGGGEKSGFGLKFGLGWSFQLQEKTLLVPQLNYSLLKMSSSDVSTVSFQLGILF